jgi:hypothetical protein
MITVQIWVWIIINPLLDLFTKNRDKSIAILSSYTLYNQYTFHNDIFSEITKSCYVSTKSKYTFYCLSVGRVGRSSKKSCDCFKGCVWVHFLFACLLLTNLCCRGLLQTPPSTLWSSVIILDTPSPSDNHVIVEWIFMANLYVYKIIKCIPEML